MNPSSRVLLLAATIGVASGLLLAGAGIDEARSHALLLAVEGTVLSAPGWQPLNCSWLTPPSNSSPSPGVCASPGIVWIDFDLEVSAYLTGRITASAPVGFVLMRTDAVYPCGYLEVGPILCPALASTAPVFVLSAPFVQLGLGSLELNFAGANNVVPPGAYQLLFVNPHPTATELTVDGPIALNP